MSHIQCSVCGTVGHNKRNKLCTAKQLVPLILKPYKRPIILFNSVITEYYSIFDKDNMSDEMIYLLMERDLIRWAYYSTKTNLYCVCNKGENPPINIYIEGYIIKIAFIITKPSRAVLHMKTWELIYTPPNTLTNDTLKECPICYDTLQSSQLIQMNCNHSFCLHCIQGCIHSVKNNDNPPFCSMCRTVVTQVTIPDILLYNTLADTLYKI